LIAKFAQTLQIIRRRGINATRTLQRLCQHGGDSRAALGHQHRYRLEIIARHLFDIGHKWPVTDFVQRQSLGARAAVISAVVGAHARNDQRSLGVPGLDMGQAREFHRRIYRLRAAAAEKNPGIGHRANRHEFCGEFFDGRAGERIKSRISLERRDLFGDGVGDFLSTMADRAVPKTRHSVHELVSIVIPNESTLTAHEFDEGVLRRFGERMQKGVAGLIHGYQR